MLRYCSLLQGAAKDPRYACGDQERVRYLLA